MDMRTLLREELKQAHGLLDEVVADCPPEIARTRGDGWTIKSIAHIYAHTVYGEDSLVQGMLQHRPALFQTGGWAARLGVAMPDDPQREPDWSSGASLDPALVREYAQAVYAATDAYLTGASDAELDRVFDTGFVGEQSVALFVSTVLAWHVTNHQGEIAALKGVQGLRGLPF